MQITITTGRLQGQTATMTHESDKSIRATLGDGSTIMLPKFSQTGPYYKEVQNARPNARA